MKHVNEKSSLLSKTSVIIRVLPYVLILYAKWIQMVWVVDPTSRISKN